MIVIVDYGMGNLRSVLNKLQRLEVDVMISSRAEDIERAEKLILPGVGFFARGMENLKALNLVPVLNKKALEEKTPVLGICLGMQIITLRSEEGDAGGLGWINAETVRFDFASVSTARKIPHMGWNSIEIQRASPLLRDLPANAKFYFVHSYHVRCHDDRNLVARTEYGYKFASVIQKENIFGTQFHPEKSHGAGMAILRNFVGLPNDV